MWAMGCILFEIYYGRTVFGRDWDVVRRRYHLQYFFYISGISPEAQAQIYEYFAICLPPTIRHGYHQVMPRWSSQCCLSLMERLDFSVVTNCTIPQT